MNSELETIIIKNLVQKGFTEQDSAILAESMINTVESMSFEQQMELIINSFTKNN